MGNRKLAFIVLALLMLSCFNACTRELRIDRHELTLRLEKKDKAYAFDSEDVIIKDGKDFVFFSLHKTDDCLLTLFYDSGQRIHSLSLSLDRSVWSQENIQKDFLPFCKEVLSAFCTDEELAQKAIKELGLEKQKTYSENHFKKEELEKYAFNIYVNDLSFVIECSYI